MNNNKEIEIKLQYKDKEAVINKLKPNLEFQREASIHDTYFGTENTSMENTNKLLRIRVTDGNKELTYKGKTKDENNIWEREEINIEIENAHKMKEILKRLDLKKISEYKSQREYYQYGEAEIVFSQFSLPAELEFMEIEASSRKKVEEIKNEISNLTKEVGEEIFSVFDKAREDKN